MTARQVRALVGPNVHVERGNARGEFVVLGTACWTVEDVQRVLTIRDRLAETVANADAVLIRQRIRAARRWGRIGGRATSAAKVRAARANGRKGGRPRKSEQ